MFQFIHVYFVHTGDMYSFGGQMKMAGGFRVPHLVSSFLAFLPEVQSADKKIPFREKIHTGISLFIFLVCSKLLLYGIHLTTEVVPS